MSARVFLDANVLFSAAWREDSGLARLWKLPQTALMSSRLALAEAGRNLDDDAQRARLQALAASLAWVDAAPDAVLPSGVSLVEKDVPILLAAIEGRASHLLTGDRRHFGALYGKSIGGVRILAPATYLASRRKPPIP